MSENSPEQEYQVAFTKLLWAAPLMNAAALLATLQVVGGMDDPDYAFKALRLSIVGMGVGSILGLIAILMMQISLSHKITAFRLMNLPANSKTRYELAHVRRSAQVQYLSLCASLMAVICLVASGAWAFRQADRGGLQPDKDPAELSVDVVDALKAIVAARRAELAAPPVPVPATGQVEPSK